MSSERPESKVIRKKTAEIADKITSGGQNQVDWFATRLAGEDFIGSALQFNVAGVPLFSQVTQMLGAVESKLRTTDQPKEVLKSFIGILKNKPVLEELTKQLIAAYESYGGTAFQSSSSTSGSSSGAGGSSSTGAGGGGGGATVPGTAAPAPAKTKDGYKKLSKRRDDIIEYLAAQQVTNKLAGKLLATEVIAKAVYDKAKVPSLVETEKVTVIFDAVLAGVKLKPAKYTQFLDILNGIEGLGDIVEFIDEPLD